MDSIFTWLYSIMVVTVAKIQLKLYVVYVWFTGINYYKLAVEKDRGSIFTTIWKPG
jgi:hypothetical protein